MSGIVKSSILKELTKQRIFSIYKGTTAINRMCEKCKKEMPFICTHAPFFHFEEECNNNYVVELNKDQMEELIKELQELLK